MSEHRDAGHRCLVAHYNDGKLQPPCILCTCGKWVRPGKWEEHKLQMTNEERRQVEYR